jgi:putative oxidoreductase
MVALRWAAWSMGVAALLHVAIVVGGPAWYRFFGAGEGMARLASGGSLYPAVLTASIATGLAVAACYGLSGAGVLRPLPWLRPVLGLIAAVFVARGLLGVPVVLLGSGSYLAELRGRWLFMVVTSLVCLALGLAYSVGAAHAGRPQAPERDATS